MARTKILKQNNTTKADYHIVEIKRGKGANKSKTKKCWSVRKTGKKRRVFSRCTTKSKALKQLRLLRAIRYNKTFRRKITQK